MHRNENDLPIIDAHVHLFSAAEIPAITEMVQQENFLAINLACVPSGLESFAGSHYNQVSFLLKAIFPDTTYLFGGLDYSAMDSGLGHIDFANQATKLIDLGADGIKMLEGKPHDRRKLGVPLDSPIYNEYYRWMELSGTPILFHVADPREFWNLKSTPRWARESGWCYAKSGFPSWEQLHDEVHGILKRSPRLKIIFAHFLFLSHDLQRSADFLDRWENVCFDLTPGIEMFFDFARDPDRWREFFCAYQDRIVFGTDRTAQEQTLPIRQFRKFLETDQPIFHGHGLGLDESVLRKIYAGNIRRIAGQRPRRVNVSGVLEDCLERLDSCSSSLKGGTAEELRSVVKQLSQLV